jgi:oxygen-independent coproporphyrinogen-3 oxidase
MDQMVEAFCKEMEIRAQTWSHKKLDSVYFGGGTPSILSPDQMDRIFQTIRRLFEINPGAEITLEANPDDIRKETIQHWNGLGINRLSIGLQSSHNERLSWMNRIHSVEEGRSAVELAQNQGIENLSLDLMYNFPGSTETELLEDIESLLALSPKHISAYGLTIEPQTVFGKRLKKGQLVPLPEETAAKQFLLVHDSLEAAGFEPYEISNFGKPGFLAVHNSAYWFQKPYLGIGPGAHGFDGNVRTENLPNNPLYIKSLLSEGVLFQKEEFLTPEEKANERILTRLRTHWGLSLSELEASTGFALAKVKSKELDLFLGQGLLVQRDETLFLTREGKLLADRIAMELMV